MTTSGRWSILTFLLQSRYNMLHMNYCCYYYKLVYCSYTKQYIQSMFTLLIHIILLSFAWLHYITLNISTPETYDFCFLLCCCIT